MSIVSIILLFTALSAPLISGSDGRDVVAGGYDTESSRLGFSRSMLRGKADGLAEVMAEKESHRDDSIPVLEGTSPSDQENRVLAKDCNTNQKYFIIDLSTDEYGFENEWTLKMRQGNTWEEVESGPPNDNNYGSNSRYVGGFCLKAGEYRFIITDLFKDGMCCAFGNGKYDGYVDGSKQFSSPSNADEDWTKQIHDFEVSTSNSNPRPPTRKPTRKPSPSGGLPIDPKIDRDKQWLVSHNTRRKGWHERYGKTYVPLKWSDALERESREFAEKLLEDSCGDLYHDKDNIHGENLASNSGSGSWAEARSTDSILKRWVEDEADDGWPGNGHLTAALWRASKYVGCGEASKRSNGGGMCHTQVCRYARPGNCNMNSYKTNKKDWWLVPMLMDDSPCSPKCPPGGCQ